METPKNITVHIEHEPDMKRMVAALRIVLEAVPPSKGGDKKQDKEPA